MTPSDENDWSLDEGLDPDGPSAEDLDRFGDELIKCPTCSTMIYDQAELCPHCGRPVSIHDAPASKNWVVVTVVVLILVLLAVWVF